jgi:hypothetical protein
MTDHENGLARDVAAMRAELSQLRLENAALKRRVDEIDGTAEPSPTAHEQLTRRGLLGKAAAAVAGATAVSVPGRAEPAAADNFNQPYLMGRLAVLEGTLNCMWHFTGSAWNSAFDVFHTDLSPTDAGIPTFEGRRVDGAIRSYSRVLPGLAAISDKHFGLYAGSNWAHGVVGRSLGTSNAHGVVGSATQGHGVFGTSNANYGVFGTSNTNDAVRGEVTNTASKASGGYFSAAGTGAGVWGEAAGATALAGVVGRTLRQGSGVWGQAWTGTGHGVFGQVVPASSPAHGVYGQAKGTGCGVFGEATATGATAGVSGRTTSGGSGVIGRAQGAYGSGVIGRIENSGNSGAALYADTIGAGVAVQGVANNAAGRGGKFQGKAAQVQLVPNATARPSSGQAGDLVVDSAKSLWFCKGGSSWVKLA